MRQYKKIKAQIQVIEKMYCNKCGKEIQIENEIVKEGVFSSTTTWGYFSEKDGDKHEFDICEKCYDEFLESFKIPVVLPE